MRSLVLLAALAVSMSFSGRALADKDADLDRCKFVGQFARANESIAACDRVINDPKASAQDRSAALSSRCGWWWTRQEVDRALSDCNEAIRSYSGNPGAYLSRGNVYLSKSDPERALSDYDAAIRLDPKSAWAYAARGNLYRNKGDLDRGLADLDEAIKLDPAYALPLFSRGEVYKAKGDFAKAMADMNETLRLDPNYAPAYFTRGQLSYIIGNNPAAIEDFTKSIRLDAENGAAYLSRGVAYYVLGGHLADAAADFKKAAEAQSQGCLCRALARSGRAAQRRAWPSGGGGQAVGHDGVAGARDPSLPWRSQRRTDFRRGLRHRSEDQAGADLRGQFLCRRICSAE